MSNVRKFLIDPIENHYGKHLPPGVTGKLANEFDARVSPELLAGVAKSLTDRLQKMPVQNAIRVAVLQAERSASSAAHARTYGPSDPAAWDWSGKESVYFRSRDQAKDICRTDLDLARRADREGWLISLIDFCQDRGRLPERPAEIEFCKARSRKAEDALTDLRDAPIGSRLSCGSSATDWKQIAGSHVYEPMVRLRRAMLDQASRIIFGDTKPGAA